jgi:dTDP-glucose pyrophosphorylase
MVGQLVDICVQPNAKIATILRLLQDNREGICVVVDESRRVLGTITDGDCRRALLRANSLDQTAEQIMNRRFIVVSESFSHDQILSLMEVNGIRQVPVVDSEQRLVDIVVKGNGELPCHNNPVIILAGGLGTRLRPLTLSKPKPLLPIGDRPMIERLIRSLVHQGFCNIYLSINYLGSMVEDYFGDGSRFNCSISYLREEKRLGTAGPLSLLVSESVLPVIVVNGDLLTAVNFESLLEYHQESGSDFTICTSESLVEIPFGVVRTADGGGVLEIVEKPSIPFTVNAGIYILHPELIKLVPQGQEYLMTEFINDLIAKGYKISNFPIHEKWIDIGRPEQYFSEHERELLQR